MLAARIFQEESSNHYNQALVQLDSWTTFDVFKVARLSNGKPLQKVVLALLDHFDLVAKLQLDRSKLVSFLRVRSLVLSG